MFDKRLSTSASNIKATKPTARLLQAFSPKKLKPSILPKKPPHQETPGYKQAPQAFKMEFRNLANHTLIIMFPCYCTREQKDNV